MSKAFAEHFLGSYEVDAQERTITILVNGTPSIRATYLIEGNQYAIGIDPLTDAAAEFLEIMSKDPDAIRDVEQYIADLGEKEFPISGAAQ